MKGSVYIMGAWAANMNNGFSALVTIKEFYYALPAVTMTAITSASLAAFDQYVPFNDSTYIRDSTQKESHTNHKYDPIKTQSLKLGNIFNRDQWISKNGISVNSDGSTNNITDYFQYVRGSWLKNFKLLWLANILWSPVCGVVLYNIGFHAFSGIINEQG